jgi:hypothetical protein
VETQVGTSSWRRDDASKTGRKEEKKEKAGKEIRK